MRGITKKQRTLSKSGLWASFDAEGLFVPESVRYTEYLSQAATEAHCWEPWKSLKKRGYTSREIKVMEVKF